MGLDFGIKSPDGKYVRTFDADNPPDWVLPDPPDLCPRCLGCYVVVEKITVVEYFRRNGKPMPFGRDGTKLVEVAEPCNCTEQKRRHQAFLNQVEGVPGKTVMASFENFGKHPDPDKNARYLANAVHVPVLREMVKKIVAGHPGPGGAILSGTVDSGKTYLAIAALKAVIVDGGRKGVFLASAELCDEIRRRAFDVDELDRYFADLKRAAFIVIDDVGSERLGKDDGAVVERYGRFLKTFETKGWVVATTNKPDLAQALRAAFGDEEGLRIARRLSEAAVDLKFVTEPATVS